MSTLFFPSKYISKDKTRILGNSSAPLFTVSQLQYFAYIFPIKVLISILYNCIAGFFHQATRSDRDMYVDIDFDAIYDYEVAMFINNTRASIKKNYVRCDETRLGKSRGCKLLGTNISLFL